METGVGDWASATIQQDVEAETTDGAGLKGCLVQMAPACDLRGPRELPDERTSIGRANECDLALHDGSISRQHAVVVRTVSGYEIQDQGSTNGTYVNDQVVSNALLSAGDVIRMGNHLFKFLLADDMEAQYHETVFSMMTRDGLTGALNKRFLTEVLPRDIARCQRSKSPLSLVMFDIDHFKSVNDNYGHLIGDEILRQVSRRVQNLLRSEDLFARYGGEEFLIALIQTDATAAAALAERIRAAVADDPFETDAGPLVVTVSLGVVELRECTAPCLDSLVHLADTRLYDAKRGGRNQVRDC